MPKQLEVRGEELRVTGNPDMGIVKYVQEMEIEMMRNYLDDETILKLDQMDSDDVMEEVLEDADIEDFKTMMWERSLQEPLQTVCLATNQKLESEWVDDMKALEWKELLEESEDALGGSASDFMAKLGIDISSTVNQMEEQMEGQGQDSPNFSQETQPPASRTLKRQSKAEGETKQ